jgi:hypothetical protein
VSEVARSICSKLVTAPSIRIRRLHKQERGLVYKKMERVVKMGNGGIQ